MRSRNLFLLTLMILASAGVCFGRAQDDPQAVLTIPRVRRPPALGLIFTDRSFETGFNRVGGIDGRLKPAQNWTAQFQAVASATRFLDGRRVSGPA